MEAHNAILVNMLMLVEARLDQGDCIDALQEQTQQAKTSDLSVDVARKQKAKASRMLLEQQSLVTI